MQPGAIPRFDAAAVVLHRREQCIADRDDDFLNEAAEQKSLDDVLHDRLSREWLELFRDRSAEARARTCGGNDD